MIIIEIIICILFLVSIFSFVRIIKLLGHEPIKKLKELVKRKPSSWPFKKILWYTFLFIILCSVFIILPTYLWKELQKAIIFTDPDAIYFSCVWWITATPVIFIAIATTGLILQFLSLLIDRHAARKHNKVPTPPNSNIKLTLWITIFLFTLGLPFIILNTDYYSYIKGNSIYTNRFFSLSEEKHDIPNDVDYAEVTYSRDDSGDPNTFYYNIYFKDNTKVEMLAFSKSENVVYVNNILKNNKINIILENISESRWAYIEHYYFSDDFVYSLKQLYNIESQ